ncbi:pca operon transcription factor PcaQ [Tistrella mobilis]|uniref:pca operon transcription factor PcaQ n=1 Tax=Tistrella mobilis TaxID=171437 RepID=UPI0035571C91
MIDRRIKFRHLTCFLEVARLRSVMAAADSLAITQPAVSKTLRELEEVLDARLFDRGRRGLTLTPFGRLFLNHAGTAVTALSDGVDAIARARTGGGGELLRIGALPTVAAQVMPTAVRRFGAGGARATVRVVDGPNTLLLAQLRIGELDLVVGRLAEPEAMTGLSFEHLYSERVTFAVRPGHPLLDHPVPDPRAVAAFPLIVPPPGSIIRPVVDRFLIAAGIRRIDGAIETVSGTFGRSYVRQSDAVWIISRGVVARDIVEGQLRELRLDTGDTSGPVGLTTRADQPPTPVLRLLIDAIRDVAADLRAADAEEELVHLLNTPTVAAGSA